MTYLPYFASGAFTDVHMGVMSVNEVVIHNQDYENGQQN